MRMKKNTRLPKLPLDLSTFAKLRESNYLYVDKTNYIYDLITGGRRYFLSRPRRFGKSLLVSTLKEVLVGEKQLFDGLWIGQSNYSWRPHGVITLDLSSLGIKDTKSFDSGLCYALAAIADDYQLGITLDTTTPELALHTLVKALHARFGHVAVLIDEYDNPILRLLSDQKMALEVRDAIRSFFSAIKALDALIDFVFITGVSSFAKAGLFSGMNNLRTITLSERFSGICGYTQAEVDSYFIDHLQAWSMRQGIAYEALHQEIKQWYNGYRFGHMAIAVYNPFSLMNALEAREFINFWFQSGAPTFLLQELKQESRKHEYQIVDPETFKTSQDTLGIFDIGAMPLPALMFQTGYLTIAGYDQSRKIYSLAYPNYEVKIALQTYLLGILAQLDLVTAERISFNLHPALEQENFEEVMLVLRQLFSNIPYQLHAKQESFYHALLQIACSASGIKAQSEYATSHGRIDLVLDLSTKWYIIEIKFNQSAQAALDQIEQQRYYEPFLKHGKPIILMGLAFHREPGTFELTYAIKKLDPA